MDVLQFILDLFSGKQGQILQIFAYVVSLSLGKKALEEFAQKLVLLIPGTRDDEWLGRLLNAKWYKKLSKVLDWFSTVKLPKSPNDAGKS